MIKTQKMLKYECFLLGLGNQSLTFLTTMSFIPNGQTAVILQENCEKCVHLSRNVALVQRSNASVKCMREESVCQFVYRHRSLKKEKKKEVHIILSSADKRHSCVF